MGFFDSVKKSKEIKNKAEWKQGLNHTIVELEKDHLKLLTAAGTDIIFYKDIVEVQQVNKVVNIRTTMRTHSLISKNNAEAAQELQLELLHKISDNN